MRGPTIENVCCRLEALEADSPLLGSFGAVTQATNKSTGVALEDFSGDITMNSASLAAGAIVNFVLTNTIIDANDLVSSAHISGGTLGAYTINAVAGAGIATFYVRNNTAGALAEAIVIRYAINKIA